MRERFNQNTQKRDAVLPPPEVLERYEKTLPGSADALIKLVKDEQDHRHQLQNKYLKSYRLGQILSFIFNIFFIAIIAKMYKYMPADSIVPHILLGAYLFIFLVSLIESRSDRKAIMLKASMKSPRREDDRPMHQRRRNFNNNRPRERRDDRRDDRRDERREERNRQ
jgi:uncharacterized membrane protein